jgi:drug/metabolite transporter (DMT)-like permease
MLDTTVLGPLSSLMSSITWAVGSAGYSRLARGHSPFAVNFGRALVALPLFVLTVCILHGGPAGALQAYTSVTTPDLGWLALSIFASYALGDTLFLWATRSLGVPAALAIGSSYPLVTAGLGAIVQGESLSARQVAGLLLAVAGVITVILTQAEPTPASSEGAHASPPKLTSKRTGVILAFATMICWAINTLATAKAGQSLAPMVGNTFRMMFAMAMTTVLGRLMAPGTEILLPSKVLKKSLPLFAFEAFGGSACFMYGLAHSPLAVGSTLSSLAPVLAVPIAWMMGLEKLSLSRTLGVCVVVLGVWLLVL